MAIKHVHVEGIMMNGGRVDTYARVSVWNFAFAAALLDLVVTYQCQSR
jgi:hypothetical protein